MRVIFLFAVLVLAVSVSARRQHLSDFKTLKNIKFMGSDVADADAADADAADADCSNGGRRSETGECPCVTCAENAWGGTCYELSEQNGNGMVDLCHNGNDLRLSINGAVNGHCKDVPGHASDFCGRCADGVQVGVEFPCDGECGQEDEENADETAEGVCMQGNGRDHSKCKHARGGNRRRSEDGVIVINFLFTPVITYDEEGNAITEPVTVAMVNEDVGDALADAGLTVISMEAGVAVTETDSSSESDDTAMIVALVAVIVISFVVMIAAFWKYGIVCFASKSKPVKPNGMSLVPSSNPGSFSNDNSVNVDFNGGDAQYTIQPWHLQQQN